MYMYLTRSLRNQLKIITYMYTSHEAQKSVKECFTSQEMNQAKQKKENEKSHKDCYIYMYLRSQEILIHHTLDTNVKTECRLM